MDLTGNHRNCYLPLRTHRHGMARIRKSTISSSNWRSIHGYGIIRCDDHCDPLQTLREMGLVHPVVLSRVLERSPVWKSSARPGSYSSDCIHHTLACLPVAFHESVLSTQNGQGRLTQNSETYLELTRQRFGSGVATRTADGRVVAHYQACTELCNFPLILEMFQIYHLQFLSPQLYIKGDNANH